MNSGYKKSNIFKAGVVLSIVVLLFSTSFFVSAGSINPGTTNKNNSPQVQDVLRAGIRFPCPDAPRPVYKGYVIITTEDWVDDFQPLADWKNKKGVGAEIVTVEDIYSSNNPMYTGCTTDVQRIDRFIENRAGLSRFFLLGGDTSFIPCNSSDDMATDTTYADVDESIDSDGCLAVEVHVGRAPVNNETQIANFISKTLQYEKNPPVSSNYPKSATFFGFDLQDDPYGVTRGSQTKEYIVDNYLPSDWVYQYEYDYETTNHLTEMVRLFNQGPHLINHIDHAESTWIGAGKIHHNTVFPDSYIDTFLTNYQQHSIMYSTGCDACAFDEEQCIGEQFMNAEVGALAFIGNARDGYHLANTYKTLSLKYDIEFFRLLFEEQVYTLGECFSLHKNNVLTEAWEDLSGDGWERRPAYKYLFKGLTLLGDPELPIWTENPQSLTVFHPETYVIDDGALFSVQVLCDGLPLENATVCLWKDGDIHEVQQTDSLGNAVFFQYVPPSTEGAMYVTVTKHNYLPYEGEAQIYRSPVATLTITSEPVNEILLNIVPEDVYGNADGITPFDRVYYLGQEITCTAPIRPIVTDIPLVFCHWVIEGVIQTDNEPLLTITVDADSVLTAVYLQLGDVNGDGYVNNGDIDPFVLALTFPDEFMSTYGSCCWRAADINGDGWVNNGDIDAFVSLL